MCQALLPEAKDKLPDVVDTVHRLGPRKPTNNQPRGQGHSHHWGHQGHVLCIFFLKHSVYNPGELARELARFESGTSSKFHPPSPSRQWSIQSHSPTNLNMHLFKWNVFAEAETQRSGDVSSGNWGSWLKTTRKEANVGKPYICHENNKSP